MARWIFRNRWIAFFWAIGLLVSISVFFGKDGGQEKLAQAASEIRAQRQAPSPTPQPEVDAAATESGYWGEDGEGDGQSDLSRGSAVDNGSGDEEADSYVILDASTPIEEADASDLAPRELR